MSLHRVQEFLQSHDLYCLLLQWEDTFECEVGPKSNYSFRNGNLYESYHSQKVHLMCIKSDAIIKPTHRTYQFAMHGIHEVNGSIYVAGGLGKTIDYIAENTGADLSGAMISGIVRKVRYGPPTCCDDLIIPDFEFSWSF